MAPEPAASPPQALAPATGGAAATSGSSSKHILVEKCLGGDDDVDGHSDNGCNTVAHTADV